MFSLSIDNLCLQTPGNDWTHTGVKHNKTRSALIRDEAVRQSGVTGPLGVGIVLQSEPNTSLHRAKQEWGGSALSSTLPDFI